jgi:NAD dependent epimerase/dehydratase family enzyme
MEQERRKTAFLSGSTGFLGRNLIEQLTESGRAVTPLHWASSDTLLSSRLRFGSL